MNLDIVKHREIIKKQINSPINNFFGNIVTYYQQQRTSL